MAAGAWNFVDSASQRENVIELSKKKIFYSLEKRNTVALLRGTRRFLHSKLASLSPARERVALMGVEAGAQQCDLLQHLGALALTGLRRRSSGVRARAWAPADGRQKRGCATAVVGRSKGAHVNVASPR